MLIETKKGMDSPIDEKILENILSIVMLNPLEEDRGTSQEQIRYYILKNVEA